MDAPARPRRWKFGAIELLVYGGIVVVLSAVVVSELNRARQNTGRLPCPSNLKQIGQAILLYANENGNAMPDSFATILRTQDLTPKDFICPSDDARAAKDVASFRGDERDCSYVYVGDGVPITAVTAEDVVAFDRPGAHESDGVNILYGDGHIEWQLFPRRQRPAWWLDIESQIARGDRPVRHRSVSTRPTTQPSR